MSHLNRLMPWVIGLLMFSTVPAAADVVILKSGEMFKTPEAWRADGQVHYYRNGQLTHVAEDAVERLIQEHKAPPTDTPSTPSVSSGKDQPRQPLPAPSTAAGDSGFLGLKWGQPLSAFKGLRLLETDPAYGGVQQYVHQNRPRRFGRASVDNIYYGFWRDALYTILIEVSNYLDYESLRAEAFRRYGQGTQPVPEMERYRWQGPTTDRMLSYDDKADTGYLWMRSRVIHQNVTSLYPE